MSCISHGEHCVHDLTACYSSCSELSYVIRDCVSNGEPGALLRACEELEAKLT